MGPKRSCHGTLTAPSTRREVNEEEEEEEKRGARAPLRTSTHRAHVEGLQWVRYCDSDLRCFSSSAYSRFSSKK